MSETRGEDEFYDSIGALAEKHKLDPLATEEVIDRAKRRYGPVPLFDAGAQRGGPDTLDEIDKPAAALLALLSDRVNRDRLGGRFTRASIRELASSLEQLRVAAREAHRTRAVGRPKSRSRSNLAAAYGCLAIWYMSQQRKFRNTWVSSDGKLLPKSGAARFLYDAMRIIAPKRARLAEQLRELMAKDVEQNRKLIRDKSAHDKAVGT